MQQDPGSGSDDEGKLPFKTHVFLRLILLLFLIPVTVSLCKTSQLYLDTAFLTAFSRKACPHRLGGEEKLAFLLARAHPPAQDPADGTPGWCFSQIMGSICFQLPRLPSPSCPPGERVAGQGKAVPGEASELCSAHFVFKTGAQTAQGAKLETPASMPVHQASLLGACAPLLRGGSQRMASLKAIHGFP